MLRKNKTLLNIKKKGKTEIIYNKNDLSLTIRS